jgi:hypothetical protein
MFGWFRKKEIVRPTSEADKLLALSETDFADIFARWIRNEDPGAHAMIVVAYANMQVMIPAYIANESRFVFDRHIQKVLDEINKERDLFLVTIEEREQINRDDVAPWRKTDEDSAKQQQKLNALYRSFPEAFENALAFRHLIERDR